MKTCEQCGGEVCPHCGKAIEKAQPPVQQVPVYPYWWYPYWQQGTTWTVPPITITPYAPGTTTNTITLTGACGTAAHTTGLVTVQ